MKHPWTRVEEQIREAAEQVEPAPIPDRPMIVTPFRIVEAVEGPSSMAFRESSFRSGLNITVRNGTKWSGTRGTVFATTVLDLPITPIEVVDTLVVTFSELQVEHSRSLLLLFAPDKRCRSYFAMLREMRAIYPGFEPSNEVTVVFFLVAEEE